MADNKDKKSKQHGKKHSKPNIRLGLTLRALREYANITPFEAAEISGLTESRIEKFESGVYTPTKTQLLAILSSYGSLNLNDVHEKKRALRNAAKDPEKKTVEDLAQEKGHNWTVYSDGSSVPNPGKGAWAYVILCDGEEVDCDSGYSKWASNNEMELTGAVRGLERLIELGVRDIDFFSDSQYVVLGANDWLDIWMESDPDLVGRPNGALWLRLADVRKKASCVFDWVKGHNGNPWNEKCDSMCESEFLMRGLPEQGYHKKNINFRRA